MSIYRSVTNNIQTDFGTYPAGNGSDSYLASALLTYDTPTTSLADLLVDVEEGDYDGVPVGLLALVDDAWVSGEEVDDPAGTLSLYEGDYFEGVWDVSPAYEGTLVDEGENEAQSVTAPYAVTLFLAYVVEPLEDDELVFSTPLTEGED